MNGGMNVKKEIYTSAKFINFSPHLIVLKIQKLENFSHISGNRGAQHVESWGCSQAHSHPGLLEIFRQLQQDVSTGRVKEGKSFFASFDSVSKQVVTPHQEYSCGLRGTAASPKYL